MDIKRSGLLVSALAGALFLSACAEKVSGPRDQDPPTPTDMPSFLTITGAKALVIEDGPGMAKRAAGLDTGIVEGDTRTARLFMLTDDNVYAEVRNIRVDTMYIQQGDSTVIVLDTVELTTIYTPRGIASAGPDYVYASFYREDEDPVPGYGITEYNYLVRRSDGAVFDAPTSFIPRETFGSEAPEPWQQNNGYGLFQADATGHIYFRDGKGLHKFDTSNPDILVYQTIVPSNVGLGEVTGFVLNAAGHIMYTESANMQPRYMLRFSGGSLRFLDSAVSFQTSYWKGFDENFYYTYPTVHEELVAQGVRKVTIAGNTATESNVAIVTHGGIGGLRFDFPELNKIVTVGGQVVAEVYNDSMQVMTFALADLGITNVSKSDFSDSHYYLSGFSGNQPVIYRIDPSVFPHVATQVTVSSDLDIRRFSVSADDAILFSALRLSDATFVMGEISPTGTVTIHHALEREVRQLHRLD